ncbi:MAG: response regulator, partial [Phycisphaeraceae bacterium]|nr:response regulator [Phycisphaeraceae bacterium]
CTVYSDFTWQQIVDHISAMDRLLIVKKPFDAMEVRQLALCLSRKWELTRQSELQLQAAHDANQAKGLFLANVSHELRTPLNAIIGFGELLCRPAAVEDAEERRQWARIIRDNGSHLLHIVNDLLDMSKIEAGHLLVELGPAQPRAIVEDVVESLKPRAIEHGLNLVLTMEADTPERIRTDANRFRQIVTNLIANALKFTRKGEIRVHLRRVPGDKPLLAVDVHDTGIGLEPGQIERLFKPFSQADPSITRVYGGTGLGLVISRKLAGLLGGDMTVRSIPDQGSTFTLTVDIGSESGSPPARIAPTSCAGGVAEESLSMDKPCAAAALAPGADVLTLKLQGRVLVVDDNAVNRELVSLILRRTGITIVEAENGRIAVDQAMAQKFDLILLDMQMPVLDGYRAARMLRDCGLTCPIIALTASAMKGDRDRCLAAGCSEYISKPIHLDCLVRTVAGLLAQEHADANAG